ATSAEAVAAKVERTICMVETTTQAESVITGEHCIIKSAQPGHIVVCMSTIDPIVARRLADQLAARRIAMIDAPVSGGTERASSGELSIIVGGAATTVAACQDLFRAMGANVFHVGALGQGLAMKLVNNMLVQVNTVAVAEALVLGVKAGLDPKTIYDVVRVSTGNSFAFETRVPKMLKRDFSPGGTVDISFKDQELETAFAKQLEQVRRGITVTTHAQEIARLLFFEDLHDVVLVGTSSGGMVICKAAELAADRLARLVFVDALALLPGERVGDIVNRPAANE